MIKTKNKFLLAILCLTFVLCSLFAFSRFNTKNVYAEEEHVHDFYFETETGKIVAICNEENCPLEDGKIEVSFSFEDVVYTNGVNWSIDFNGKEQFEQTVGKTLTVSYTLNGNEWSGINRAGEYVATVSLDEVSASITFKVKKAPNLTVVTCEAVSPTSVGGKDGMIFVTAQNHVEISSGDIDGEYITPGDVKDGKITITGLRAGTYYVRTREVVNYLAGEPVEIVVPVHEHVFEFEIEDERYVKDVPTCTEEGMYYRSCACGVGDFDNDENTFKGQTKDIHNHNFGEGVLQTAPAIGEMGVIIYSCTDCGNAKLEYVPALKAEVNTENKDLVISLDCGYEQSILLNSEFFENYDIKKAVKSGELKYDYSSVLYKNEYVVNAYTVKLIDSNNGCEVKFDDIKQESKLNVKLAVPKGVDYNEMKVLVVDNDGNAKIYTLGDEKYSFEYNDGYITLLLDSVKEIAIIDKTETKLYYAIFAVGVLFFLFALINLFVKKGKKKCGPLFITFLSITVLLCAGLGAIGYFIFGNKLSAMIGIDALGLTVIMAIINFLFGPGKNKSK